MCSTDRPLFDMLLLFLQMTKGKKLSRGGSTAYNEKEKKKQEALLGHYLEGCHQGIEGTDDYILTSGASARLLLDDNRRETIPGRSWGPLPKGRAMDEMEENRRDPGGVLPNSVCHCLFNGLPSRFCGTRTGCRFLPRHSLICLGWQQDGQSLSACRFSTTQHLRKGYPRDLFWFFCR